MQRFMAGILVCFLACSPALAQTTVCASKAIGKNGKPLAGAARMSAIKKCCMQGALSKDGKPLAGAAKQSFVKKCMQPA